MVMICFLLLSVVTLCSGAGNLCVAENGGHGEQPPPIGDLIRINGDTRSGEVIAKGLQDPVWVATDAEFAYVGLFHAGAIVRTSLKDGTTKTVASGLSCPEGVGIDGEYVYTVNNPVGDECRGTNLTDHGALVRVTLSSGDQKEICELKSPHGMAVEGGYAYVCEWGTHQLTKVDLKSGVKVSVAKLNSPSGCAVGGGYAYAVEQGSHGSLVQITLKSGAKKTLAENLRGPMGVAVDKEYVYVGERSINQVQRIRLSDGKAEVFAKQLNSPIGLAPC